MSEETIGLPAAMASRRMMPKLSCPVDGAQKISAVW
jgi:hypothetical protein